MDSWLCNRGIWSKSVIWYFEKHTKHWRMKTRNGQVHWPQFNSEDSKTVQISVTPITVINQNTCKFSIIFRIVWHLRIWIRFLVWKSRSYAAHSNWIIKSKQAQRFFGVLIRSRRMQRVEFNLTDHLKFSSMDKQKFWSLDKQNSVGKSACRSKSKSWIWGKLNLEAPPFLLWQMACAFQECDVRMWCVRTSLQALKLC